ncbi:MAG TPA: DUF456 domain-containing protein [Kiritimatiellia bacterium]|nr:DUF456 domain-containing protein [Kiritimatiellia bacterium]
MDAIQSTLSAIGQGAGWLGVVSCCLLGVLLSAVGISGTWLVVFATALSIVLTESAFPTWSIVAGMAVIAAGVEVAEWTAGHWGVKRRGGSGWAGVAAAFGGIAGALLGLFIPIPLIGSFIGMLAGSFGLAYWVEVRRLRASAPAAHIATGAVLACIAVVLLKITVTLALTAWLALGLWLAP